MSTLFASLDVVPSLNESVTKSKQWPAWTGSLDDFRRLLRRMEKHFESLIPEHIEEETSYLRGRLAYPQERLKLIGDQLQAAPQYEAPLLESERLRLEAEIQELQTRVREAEEEAAAGGRIELSLTSRDNERRNVTGTAEELAEYIDGRDIQDMEVSGPSGAILGHSIVVRASRRAGLFVRVSSTDSKWCLAAFAEIESEVQRQLPRWHFMRSRYVLMFSFTLAAFSLLWFGLDAVAKATTATGKFNDSDMFWAYGALILWTVMVALYGTEWTRRHVPAFEIVPLNGRSRGKAIVSIVISAVGAIVLGVVATGISNEVFKSSSGG